MDFSSSYSYRLVCWELPSFEDIGRRNISLLSNIMGVSGILSVMFKVLKIHVKNSAVMSLTRNIDLVTEGNSHPYGT